MQLASRTSVIVIYVLLVTIAMLLVGLLWTAHRLLRIPHPIRMYYANQSQFADYVTSALAGHVTRVRTHGWYYDIEYQVPPQFAMEGMRYIRGSQNCMYFEFPGMPFELTQFLVYRSDANAACDTSEMQCIHALGGNWHYCIEIPP